MSLHFFCRTNCAALFPTRRQHRYHLLSFPVWCCRPLPRHIVSLLPYTYWGLRTPGRATRLPTTVFLLPRQKPGTWSLCGRNEEHTSCRYDTPCHLQFRDV